MIFNCCMHHAVEDAVSVNFSNNLHLFVSYMYYKYIHLDEYIIGRVIKAMGFSWHDKCFRCTACNISLADIGFVKNGIR